MEGTETSRKNTLATVTETSLLHDRFAELEAKHGKLMELAEVDLTPQFSVALTAVCGDKEMAIDVPNKQTIGREISLALAKTACFEVSLNDQCSWNNLLQP